jgi:Na+/melibiose symporter-like transporter
MGKSGMMDEKSGYAIGGGLLMGLGVGFFFLQQNALEFVACMLIGLGLGLMVATIVSRGK